MKQFFNLVVPMAGRGSRFTEQGYTDSKPFIDVNGKPMIQRVIENLNFEFNPEYKTIILCQKSDYERYDFSIFEEIIGHSNIEIIQVDGITEGAACTLLLAKKFIDSDVPMMSFNTDQMIDYDVEGTFSKMQNYDGGIPCFWGDSKDWSYAKTDEFGFVTEVAEKKVISNDATAGYYYWSKGSDFVKYAEQMIAANDRVNNEFYVAPVYNYAIKDGKKICITHVDSIYELGTPEYLQRYLKLVELKELVYNSEHCYLPVVVNGKLIRDGKRRFAENQHMRLDYFDVEGKTVVDFGSNTGYLTIECLKKGASYCLGIESPNNRFTKIARLTAEASGLENIDFIKNDIAVPKNTFNYGFRGDIPKHISNKLPFDVGLLLSPFSVNFIEDGIEYGELSYQDCISQLSLIVHYAKVWYVEPTLAIRNRPSEKETVRDWGLQFLNKFGEVEFLGYTDYQNRPLFKITT